MKRLPRKKFAAMSYSDIKSLKRSETQTLLALARKEFQRQAASFEKNQKTVYSHAYEQMKSYYKYKKLTAPSKTKVADAKSELEHLRKFFSSESSTIKGARNIIREQSARIFGENEAGKPNYVMSASQAAEYWATYNEYMSLYKTDSRFDSYRIQQLLGVYVLNSKDFKKNRRADDFFFTAGDFERVHEKLMELDEIMSKENWEDDYIEWKRNVLSGD